MSKAKKEIVRRLFIIKENGSTIDRDTFIKTLINDEFDEAVVEEAMEKLHHEGIFICNNQIIKVLL